MPYNRPIIPIYSMDFRPITPPDRAAIQAISLGSGLRNCNFTFANLYGWQFNFDTCFAIADDALVIRFNFNGDTAHIICTKHPLTKALLEPLFADRKLTLLALNDEQAAHLSTLYPGQTSITPLRDNCDYIYLRSELEEMRGKNLKNKRNHVNKFKAEHPSFLYRELTPALFDECRTLEAQWRELHDDPTTAPTTAIEQQVMERVFAHWEELGTIGGCIYAEGRMVAFSYGAAVTTDTFDVCVEKANRTVDGAFSIINQQLVEHLPEQFAYINREEDMGLPGLRKAKLSYHPHLILPFNRADISLS